MYPEYPFNKTETKLTATKDSETGIWEVYLTLAVSRSEDGENWETQDVDVTAHSEDLETAVNQVHLSMGTFLQSVGDIFAIEETTEDVS